MSGADSILGFLRAREMGMKSGKNKNDYTYFLKKHAEEKAAKPNTNKSFDVSRVTKSTAIVEFSPDGKLVASGHGDHSIRVSELSTGKCIQTLTGHLRTLWTLAFHNSYKNVLASACLGGQVRIWDLKSGGSETWFYPEIRSICSICFHPVQPLLLMAISDRIYAWNWTVGKPVFFVMAPKPDKIRWLKFHPSGSWLYTGISNGVTTSESYQRPSFSSYDHLLHSINSMRSRNAGDEAEAEEDNSRITTFMALRGTLQNLRSGSRNERSGITSFASGERGASSAEEEDGESNDYFRFRSTRQRFVPPSERHQERRNQSRWRRATNNFMGLDEWSRSRRNFESTSSNRAVTHRNSEPNRHPCNIWQQRRTGAEESRSRNDLSRGYGSRYEGGSSVLEDRVNRRMRSSFYDEPFRSRRDNEDSEVFGIFGRWPDRPERPSPPEILSRLGNDSVMNLMTAESPTQPRLSSSPDFSRVLALEVQDGLNRVIRETMSEDDLNVENDQPTSSLFNRNNEMTGVFDMEWDNPLHETTQNNPPTALIGTEFLASSSDQFLEESPSDNLPFDILRDLNMPIALECEQPVAVPPVLQLTSPEGHTTRQDLEQENRNGEGVGDENTAASGSISSQSRDERNSNTIASLGDIDNLHQEVEEQLNDMSGMVELRSRISRLREYLNGIDAAAAPSTSEIVISNSSRQTSVSSDPTVAEGSLEHSLSDDRREDVSHSAAARVQLGTLDDLFVAALGVGGSRAEDHGASTLGGEPVAGCSGSSRMSENGSGSNKMMKEDNINRKRRRSDDSSDDDDDDYRNMKGLVRRSRHRIFDPDDDCTSNGVCATSDTSISGLEQSQEICKTNSATPIVNGSTAEGLNTDAAMNASFASASTTATSSSTSVIGQIPSSRDAASSTVTNFSVDDDDDDEDEQDQQSRQQTSSITSPRPLAVVFALNSPPISPPFNFASPSTSRTSSRVAPMRSSHNDLFQTSSINPLDWSLEPPSMSVHLRDEDEMSRETTTDHDYMGHRSNSSRYNNTRSTTNGNSGIGRGGRIGNFMETFFIRRGRGSANRPMAHSSRQPPSYDSVVRNRARILTPPLINSGNNNPSTRNGSDTRSFFGFSAFDIDSSANNMSDDDDDDDDDNNGSSGINSFLNIMRQRSSTSRQNVSLIPGSSIPFNVGMRTSNAGASSSHREATGGSSSNNDRRNLRYRFNRNAGRLNDDEEEENDETYRASNDEDFQDPSLLRNYSSRTNHIRIPRTATNQRNRHIFFSLVPEADTSRVQINDSYRIQAWNFLPFQCPNLKKTTYNVVVPHANIHNDSTVDISKDGRMLCTFVTNDKSENFRREIGVFSLEIGSLGNCLFHFNLGFMGISLSLSPGGHYLLVGIIPGKFDFFSFANRVIGHIYKLKPCTNKNQKPGSFELFSEVIQPCSDWSITSDDIAPVGANCARWIEGEGEGLVYGSNKGDLIVFTPKLYGPDLKRRRNDDSSSDRMGSLSFSLGLAAGIEDLMILRAQNNATNIV